MPPAALLAGIYARISSDREGRELGVTRQLEDCRALAREVGATVVDEYVDNDVSASTRSRAKRPEFERMLADVRSGRINVIIYYSSSRLTRRPLEFEQIIQLVEQTGVSLISKMSGTVDLTTASGRMLGRILAARDAAETEEASERIIRALQQNREQGKPHGGGHMRGWLLPDPERGIGFMTHLDPEAVRWVNWAADWLLSGGTKLGIVRRWNEANFKGAKGAKWTISSVRQFLSSPRLAGLMSYKGEITGPGDWPAVLDPDKWRAIQPILNAPRRRNSHPLVRKHLLPGFVKCGNCGTTMIARVTASKVHQMACSPSQRGGCGGVARNMEWLEAVVSEYVSERIRQEEGNGAEIEETPESQLIKKAIAEREERLKEARQAAMEGVMPMADAGEIMAELRAQIEELREQQAEAIAAERRATMTRDEVLAAWHSTDSELLGQRRRILAQYVKAVIVHPLPRSRRWRKDTLPLDSITILPAE